MASEKSVLVNFKNGSTSLTRFGELWRCDLCFLLRLGVLVLSFILSSLSVYVSRYGFCGKN